MFTQDTYEIWEDDGLVALVRIVGWDAVAITQATIDSIEYHVFDMDDNNKQTSPESNSLDPADVIYDTPQVDNGWPYDDGFNMRHLVPASCFPVGGHTYRLRYRLTPTGAEPQTFSVVYKKIFAHDLLQR
jgi:hypothetical protein